MSRDVESEIIVKTETLYTGRKITLRKVSVKLPSGKVLTRDIVNHPGSVAILPLLDDDTLILVEQYRTAAGKTMLEIPAGTMDRDEDPEKCARRELLEETGFQAKKMIKIAEYYPSPGYTSEKMHFYIATGLTQKKQNQDEDENITVKTMKVKQIRRKIGKGEIEDMKTICSILMLKFNDK